MVPHARVSSLSCVIRNTTYSTSTVCLAPLPSPLSLLQLVPSSHFTLTTLQSKYGEPNVAYGNPARDSEWPAHTQGSPHILGWDLD